MSSALLGGQFDVPAQHNPKVLFQLWPAEILINRNRTGQFNDVQGERLPLNTGSDGQFLPSVIGRIKNGAGKGIGGISPKVTLT